MQECHLRHLASLTNLVQAFWLHGFTVIKQTKLDKSSKEKLRGNRNFSKYIIKKRTIKKWIKKYFILLESQCTQLLHYFLQKKKQNKKVFGADS